MKKKLVSVLMCMAMGATLLAGCGSEEAADSSNTTAADAADADTAADSEAADASDAADAADAADGDVIKIGFAQVGHESDWRTASTNSAQSIFSAENGYDLQFVDCDQDSAVQLEAVRGFIEQDVDYIIIDPIVSTGWDTVLTECEEAGIPVIVIDRTIDDSDKYISWVGSNFKNEGLAAGEWLKAYTDAKGISDVNVLVIEGTTGASAQINVVVCQNDNEAFGAMDAMKAAGISYGVDGDVILISFDACTAGLEYVMSGDINADFECNPLAAPFVEDVIKQLESGSTPDKEVYMVEHWYVNEDILSSITVNGEEQELTVVTQEIVDAQY